MIESIHIKNFRGIQDGKIDRFSKINLLVGPNNSGKSAVLEAIYLSNTASRKSVVSSFGINYDATAPEQDLLGYDPMEIVCERHMKKIETAQSSATISRQSAGKHSKGFSIQLGLGGIISKVALFSIETGSGFAREANEKKDEKFFFSLGKSFFAADFADPGIIVDKRLVYCWENGLTYYQAGEAAWIVEGQIPCAQNTLFFDVQNTLRHLPFEFFRKMIVTVPGWTQKIGRRFGQVFDLSKQFNVNFFQSQDALHLTQGYISPEDKIALAIDDYGDGSRSAFKLLTPLIALAELATKEVPGVFIWEEPELFQNPQSLGKLLAEVAALIKDKPIQVFIATHSIEVVAQFVRLVNEKAIADDELSAIRLNLQDGQLASSAFNHEEIQRWTAMNLDIRVPQGEVDSPLRFQFKENRNDEAED